MERHGREGESGAAIGEDVQDAQVHVLAHGEDWL